MFFFHPIGTDIVFAVWLDHLLLLSVATELSVLKNTDLWLSPIYRRLIFTQIYKESYNIVSDWRNNNLFNR